MWTQKSSIEYSGSEDDEESNESKACSSCCGKKSSVEQNPSGSKKNVITQGQLISVR